MLSLAELMLNAEDFLCGIELVSTRGTMAESRAIKIRDLANELVDCDRIHWISITDNAGGNPMMGPVALGKPVLYAGKEVVIHLSCKDFNRNGLESEAWQLASEGFHNILALSGDYPVSGIGGKAKPVFDIDSTGLITLLERMNNGLTTGAASLKGRERPMDKTQFFIGAVTTNFKLHENEVMPQYLKLEKKIECGARFIINQIGFDSRKQHELKIYLERAGHGHVPLIGNVYLLNPRVVETFARGSIPGVVVSDELLAVCRRRAQSADRGKGFFIELAARQMAIFRGLGYRGVYLGGIERYADLERIFALEASFGADDWKEFAREIRYSRPDEFFLFDENPETGLARPERLNPDYEASLKRRRPTHNVTLGYRFSKFMHERMFTPGEGLWNWGERLCRSAPDSYQGPRWMRMAEHLGKAAMFKCKDCGDCSLPDIAYLCPESQCAKNQRNGPCGGTRDGLCEVDDFECIWSRAYDRLKYEGREKAMLDHVPVIQDQGLRGTSSWANTWLGRDHYGRKRAEDEAESSQKGENETAKTRTAEKSKSDKTLV